MDAQPGSHRSRHPSVATPTLKLVPEVPVPARVRMPWGARVLAGLAVIQGIGGLVGMAILLTNVHGSAELPVSSLHAFGLHSYLVPALVLGLPLGIGALVAAYGLWRRPAWRWTRPLVGWTREHWAWVGAAAVACGVIALIALEVSLTPIRSPLQWAFGTVAALMAIAAALPSVRRHYAER